MKNKSIKIISLVTCLILLLNIIVLNITYAQTGKPELKVTADKTQIERGEEVIVTVSLNTNSNENVTSLQIELDYDSDVFEVSKITRGIKNILTEDEENSGDEAEAYLANTDIAGEVKVAYTITRPFDYNGTVFQVTFTAKEDATLGETDFEINTDGTYPIQDSINNQAVESTITNASVEIILPLESISLSSTTAELWVGETKTLNVTYNPSDTTETGVTWKSSDTSVATVSSAGVVTAVGKGNATITATATNGKTATCNVTVKQEITGVSLNKISLDLEKGDTVNITATIKPSNADGDKTITWTSSNTSVATVSSTGVVTAVGKGNTTITATTSNGLTATCNVTVGVTLKSISLDTTEKTLTKTSTNAESFTLNIEYNPSDADTSKEITWTSSDTSVATVSSTGVVTAVGAGTTTITATTVNGLTATCKVIVEIPLTSISIKEATSLEYGQTERLIVTYVEADTTEDTTISWSSSDKNVATISSNGTITATGVGTATITAKTLNGLTANCEVTVTPVELDSISIKEQNIILEKGITDTMTLTVTYNPENTTDDKTVSWTSSDSSVVSVDEDGKIIALKKGTSTITATVGDKTATTEVTVNVPIQSITLNKTEATLKLTDNSAETINLSVTYNPSAEETTDDTTVTWTSTDTSVISVDENGVVTAVGAGTAYAKAIVGDNEASCKITVEIPLEGIEIQEDNVEILKGQTSQIVVTFKPENTTYSGAISYSSLDTSIVTVDENGIISAVAAGTTSIEITVVDGDNTYTQTIEVTVSEIPLDSIAINTTDFELQKGSTEQLSIIYEPENTTDGTTVIWASSDTSIATVDENGIVTAASVGTATITATVGEKVATVEVTVTKVPITAIELNADSTELNIGDTLDLEISVSPQNADYDLSELTFSSSNTDILYIDEDGNIIAKSEGTAILTVETSDGTKSQIEIVVINKSSANTENNTGSEDAENATDENNTTNEVTNEVNTSNEESTTTNTETATTNSSESTSVLPYTGDTSIEIIIALMVISGIGIVAIIIKRIKRN